MKGLVNNKLNPTTIVVIHIIIVNLKYLAGLKVQNV